MAAHFVGHLSQVSRDLIASLASVRSGDIQKSLKGETIDVIDRVRILSEKTISRNKIALAVSLNIINAFNISREYKRDAQVLANVPYIRRIIEDLRDKLSVP